jgi:GNAT superfamily N-acetyltransferase
MGDGLYCRKRIAAGSVIGFYAATITDAANLEPDDRAYAVKLGGSQIAVAEGRDDLARKNPMALINEPTQGQKANCDMVSYKVDELGNFSDKLYSSPYICAIVACTDIPQFSQLLWHYGNSYSRSYEIGTACRVSKAHATLDSILLALPRGASGYPTFPKDAAVFKRSPTVEITELTRADDNDRIRRALYTLSFGNGTCHPRNLERAAFAAEYCLYESIPSRRAWTDEMLYSESTYFAAFERGKLVGVIGRMPDGYISRFAVAPESRGTRVGSRLLKHVIQNFRSDRDLHLWVVTPDPNKTYHIEQRAASSVLLRRWPRLISFYERHGFVRHERTASDIEEGITRLTRLKLPRLYKRYWLPLIYRKI